MDAAVIAPDRAGTVTASRLENATKQSKPRSDAIGTDRF